MQITKLQFKKLVMVYSIATILYFVTSFLLEGPVEESDELPTLVLVYGLAIIGLMVWTVVNMHSLYNFKKFAPQHLLLISLVGLLVYLGDYYFTVTSVITSVPVAYGFMDMLSYIFYDIGLFLSGAILALVYFSNIADEFKKSPESIVPKLAN